MAYIYTSEDLKAMQNWCMTKKIQVTQTKYLEYYQHYDGEVYVSFSGGKDSTVLSDVIARACRAFGHKLILVFADTGLEYPEIRQFTKDFSQWLRDTYLIEVELVRVIPEKYNRSKKQYERITFKEVIEKHGYPVVSKKVANSIARFRIDPSEEWRWNKFINGYEKDGRKTQFVIPKKWQDLAINAPFRVSDNCCMIMKHQPCIRYEKKSGNKPIIAMMADDDNKREQQYRETGCNAFNLKRPMSNPMGFWTNQDVLNYIRTFSIPYCSVYGDIIEEENVLGTSGVRRTGCMFCMFGVHAEQEPNRFQQMKITHPKQYDYCINKLGEGKVLDYIGVKY